MDNLAVSGKENSQVQFSPSNESLKAEEANTHQLSPVEAPKPSEKTFTQSDIDRIVGRTREQVREEYYKRGKQDALSEYSRQQSESTHTQSMGGMNQLNADEIDKIVEQKIKERADAQTANNIAYDFINKMKAAKDKYTDFDETVAQLNLPAHPQVIYWANSLDNTADVVYEIAKNPEKFATILMLSHTSPDLARRKMQELSSSLKQNEDATKLPHVNEPLSQLKPSALGMDNGSMTVRDLRKQPWLRG